MGAPGIMWTKDKSETPPELNPDSQLKDLFHIGYIIEKSISGSEQDIEDGQEIEVVLSSNAYVASKSGSIKPAKKMESLRVKLPSGKIGVFFNRVTFNETK